MIDPRYREYLTALEIDDAQRRPERAKRLAFFDRVFQTNFCGFFGGHDSVGVYRELRSAFAEGLYLTTLILVLSCIEKELGAKLFARGMSTKINANVAEIAYAANEIDSTLLERIRDLARTTDAYESFRPPVQGAHTASFAMHNKLGQHALTEQDACEAIEVLAALLGLPTGPL